ncbi:MAG: DUF5615 family PIN-like protein [Chloroflexi bacterium]|nr:DUF5615 family PIN-like protein [Chloroflexota bacterium]
MSVTLYMDAHVPRAITYTLRLRGVNVLTAQEDDAASLSDSELLDRASSLQRVLFTFDSDLLAIAAERQRAVMPFAGLIYTHPLRSSVRACVHDLELFAKVAEPEELANQVEFIPL